MASKKNKTIDSEQQKGGIGNIISSVKNTFSSDYIAYPLIGFGAGFIGSLVLGSIQPNLFNPIRITGPIVLDSLVIGAVFAGLFFVGALFKNFFSNIINGVKNTFGIGKQKSKEQGQEIQQASEKENEKEQPQDVDKEEEKQPDSEEKNEKDSDVDKNEKNDNKQPDPENKKPEQKEGEDQNSILKPNSENSSNPIQNKPPNPISKDQTPSVQNKENKDDDQIKQSASKQTKADKKSIVSIKNENSALNKDKKEVNNVIQMPSLNKIEERPKLYPSLNGNQEIASSVNKNNDIYSTTC